MIVDEKTPALNPWHVIHSRKIVGSIVLLLGGGIAKTLWDAYEDFEDADEGMSLEDYIENPDVTEITVDSFWQQQFYERTGHNLSLGTVLEYNINTHTINAVDNGTTIARYTAPAGMDDLNDLEKTTFGDIFELFAHHDILMDSYKTGIQQGQALMQPLLDQAYTMLGENDTTIKGTGVLLQALIVGYNLDIPGLNATNPYDIVNATEQILDAVEQKIYDLEQSQIVVENPVIPGAELGPRLDNLSQEEKDRIPAYSQLQKYINNDTNTFLLGVVNPQEGEDGRLAYMGMTAQGPRAHEVTVPNDILEALVATEV